MNNNNNNKSNLVVNHQQQKEEDDDDKVTKADFDPTAEKTQADLNRKLNLLKQLKITFESLLFNANSTNSPKVWSNGIMIIFTKNIQAILQDELIESNEVRIAEQQQQRPQSFSLYSSSYNAAPRHNTVSSSSSSSFQPQPVPTLTSNQLWSYIVNTLKHSQVTDEEAKKLLIKLDNEFNINKINNKNVNICLDWIISSLKSYTLLKQLKALYEERTNAFYAYYKKSSILNDNLFLRDFLIYISAYESQDFNRLDDIQVFKIYNQQKRMSIDQSNNRLLTVSSHEIHLKLKPNNHRRLHSCPIILPAIESTTAAYSENVEFGENQNSQTIFDLEIQDLKVNVVENQEDTKSIKETKNEEEQQEDCLFDKYSILEYINSQQIYYDRNLLDKENCHFLVADLAISSIELMKRSEEDETRTEHVQMRNINNLIVEPMNLKSYHFKFLNDENNVKPEFDNNSGMLSSLPLITFSGPEEVTEVIEKEAETTDNEASFVNSDAEDSETIDFSIDLESNGKESIKLQQQQSRERRFSWEFDLNDYQYTPESICKALFKKSNHKVPKMRDLRTILESKAYAEFTRWFLREKSAQRHLLTDSTLTLTSPATGLSLSPSIGSFKQAAALIGDEKWAPVREQLIIADLKKQKPNRNDIIKQQDYRCASCGIKVRVDKIKQFRYCEYFSKYFCRCCHSKQESYIPSYIIFNLDFKNSYLVSNKAKKFLDKIYYEPLITLEDLNPELFKMSSNRMSNLFAKIKYIRLKLVDCKRYITSCRLAIDLKKYLEENFSDFLYTDTRVYSIDSLYKLKKAKLYDQLKFILSKSLQHIYSCEICSQQGFLCEICKNTKLIYPFDIDNVIKCPNCLTCFHKLCFKQPDDCLKCKRKRLRGTMSSFNA